MSVSMAANINSPSVIDPTKDILTEIRIRAQRPQEEGSAFIRFESRSALALPMVNVAAWIRIVDQRITNASYPCYIQHHGRLALDFDVDPLIE